MGEVLMHPIDGAGSGTSDKPVEVSFEKATSVTDGTIVVYKIGHLLQIYASDLSVKRFTGRPDAGVCSIHNFDGLKSVTSVATWTAVNYQNYTSGAGCVVAAPSGDPDTFEVILIGEPGSSQNGVSFSITIPLLDD